MGAPSPKGWATLLISGPVAYSGTLLDESASIFPPALVVSQQEMGVLRLSFAARDSLTTRKENVLGHEDFQNTSESNGMHIQMYG